MVFFTFLKDCADVQEWISDQQLKAASEDYGNDVEHVELLIQAYDIFLMNLNSNERRIEVCIDDGNKLIAEQNEHSCHVDNKITEIKSQWEDLMELAQARHEALAGAKQVSNF